MSGSLVPADCVVVQIGTMELDVDQSTLTGESTTVKRGYGTVLLSSSIVKSGEAQCIVTATGLRTLMLSHLKAIVCRQGHVHWRNGALGQHSDCQRRVSESAHAHRQLSHPLRFRAGSAHYHLFSVHQNGLSA